MNLPKNAEKSVAAIVSLLDVGKPEIVRTADIAEAAGVRTSEINRARRLLESVGSLTSTIKRDARHGITTTTYTLLDPPEIVVQKIGALDYPTYSHWRAEANNEKYLYAHGIIKPRPKLESVEILPEPATLHIEAGVSFKETALPVKSLEALAPLRKSEPRAFVEAARQYRARWEIAEQHAKALVEAGLATDTGIIIEALNLKEEDEFESVIRVLPYIDELERQVMNLEKMYEPLRQKAHKAEDLEIENRKLRDQNTRLISATR